jgi:thioredoxin 1
MHILFLGEPRMINEPIHVTDAAFEKTVLQSTVPVIVDFWAPWCGPCRMIGPVLEKVAMDYAGKVIVAKVNTDEHSEYAQKYGVQGIPTLLFVANGKIIHRQVGFAGEAMLKAVVAEFITVTQSATAAN